MLHFLHIPRTGGTVRRYALQPLLRDRTVIASNHSVRLSDVRPEDRPVVILRDPVDHFRSCWDHITPLHRYLNGSKFLSEWSTVDVLIEDLPRAYDYIMDKGLWMFRRFTWWVNADRADAIYGRQERLEHDLGLILDEHAHGQGHLAKRLTDAQSLDWQDPSIKRTRFTVDQYTRLMEFYADDIALVERLAPL
jgi:hypothetical protein